MIAIYDLGDYVIYFIIKFLRRYLFLWGHELANSFLLFRLQRSFLQMIVNFSKRQITFLRNVVVTFALFDDFRLQVERLVVVFDCPYVL